MSLNLSPFEENGRLHLTRAALDLGHRAFAAVEQLQVRHTDSVQYRLFVNALQTNCAPQASCVCYANPEAAKTAMMVVPASNRAPMMSMPPIAKS